MTIWGGALAPRGIDRPGTGRDTHSPTTFIRDLGAAYRASGRERAAAGRLRLPPVPESSSIPPDRPTDPSSTSIGLADYEKLGRCSARPSGAGRCRSSTASRRRDGDPGRRRRRSYDGRRSVGEAGRRGDAGRVLPRRDRARGLPGERRGAPALPLARRARPRRLAVGRLLRRRHAEGEPRAGPQGDPRPRGERLLSAYERS